MFRTLSRSSKGVSFGFCNYRNVGTRYASSGLFDDKNEYEIDIISLKKKSKPKQRTGFSATSLKKNVDFLIRTARALKDDQRTPPRSSGSNVWSYWDFLEKYHYELQRFLNFARQSYTNKIKSFGQMTAGEVRNSLYIFKDMYMKNKVPDINKYNFASYNHMISRLLKYLEHDPRLPTFLAENMDVDYHSNKVILNLYRAGIGDYFEELENIAKSFDIEKHPVSAISASISQIIEEFNDFVQTEHLNYDEMFFKGYIQVQRYKNLKTILDNFPVTPQHLNFILHDMNSLALVETFKDISGEKEKFAQVIDDNGPGLKLVSFMEKDSLSSIPKFMSLLYLKSVASNDDVLTRISQNLIESLLPFFTNGSMQKWNPSTIIDDSCDPVEVFQNRTENYEFAVLKKFNLLEKIDAIRMTRDYLKTSFSSTTVEELYFEVGNLQKGFSGHPLIASQLSEFEVNLFEMKKYISWGLTFIDKLLSSAVWREEIQKLYEPGTSDVDSEYVQIPDELGLHHFYKELSELREREFGGFHYGLFERGTVLAILESVASRILNSTSCGSSFKFVELYHKVRMLLTINGGNTSILDSLIHSQEVFRNFEQKNEGYESEYTQIPEHVDIYNYSRELSYLRDALQTNFANTSPEGIMHVLDKIIRESISTPSKNESMNSSRLLRLEYNLIKYFKINDSTNMLDTVLQNRQAFEEFEKSKGKGSSYVQIPDNIGLHEYAKQLKALRDLKLGGSFNDRSSDEVLTQLDQLLSDVAENAVSSKDVQFPSLGSLYELKRKLLALFALNGGHVDILDTMLESHSAFEKFERSLLDKASKLYRQVPDFMKLDDYIYELEELRHELKTTAFEQVTCTDILNCLSDMSNDKRNVQEKQKIYSKLYYNLSSLFKYNGGYTFVLDNVLLNQDVFSRFERKLIMLASGKVDPALLETLILVNNNWQILDDFFVNEGVNVRSSVLTSASEFIPALGVFLLKNVNEVLREKYLMLIDTSSKLNTKVRYYPLFLYELVRLKKLRVNIFKYQLPRIYSESYKSSIYNSSNESDACYHNDSWMVSELECNNENCGFQSVLLNKLSIEGKLNQETDMNVGEASNDPWLSNNVERYNEDDGLHQLPMKKIPMEGIHKDGESTVVSSSSNDPWISNDMVQYNEDDGLHQLPLEKAPLENKYNEKGTNASSSVNDPWISSDLERNNEDDGLHQLTVEKTTVESKQRNKEATDDASPSNDPWLSSALERYNEDDGLHQFPLEKSFVGDKGDLKKLDTEKADMTNDPWISSEMVRCNDEDGLHVDPMKINSTKYGEDLESQRDKWVLSNENEKFNEDDGTEEKLNGYAAFDPKLKQNDLAEGFEIPYQSEPWLSSEQKPIDEWRNTDAENESTRNDINTATIENYLKNAKKEKELAEESNFRTREAYDWSKGMCVSRSLEHRNFFDPVMKYTSEDSSDRFFTRGNNKTRYLLVTIDGQSIVSEDNPLGKSNSEDIYTILRKVSDKDLNIVMKRIRRLQSKNWKLIGGGSKDGILIFEKNASGVFPKIKKIISAVFFAAMIWYFYPSHPKATEEKDKNSDSTDMSPEGDEEAKGEEKVYSWKSVLWSTK